MAHLSRIIHPLDYSAWAETALVQALALARRRGTDLQVVHVIPRNRSAKEVGAQRARLREFVDTHNTLGIDVHTVILVGDPLAAVVNHARHYSPDLLVVGKHGRPGSIHWRAGVFAKEIANRVQCSTLMVQDGVGEPPSADGLFREILSPAISSTAMVSVLNEALSLTQESGGRLTVLQALKELPDEVAHRRARAFSQERRGLTEEVARHLARCTAHEAVIRHAMRTRVASGALREAILSTAAEITSDLIVMGLPVRGVDDPIRMVSTTSFVLRWARCPVLLVPVPSTGARDDEIASLSVVHRARSTHSVRSVGEGTCAAQLAETVAPT